MEIVVRAASGATHTFELEGSVSIAKVKAKIDQPRHLLHACRLLWASTIEIGQRRVIAGLAFTHPVMRQRCSH